MKQLFILALSLTFLLSCTSEQKQDSSEADEKSAMPKLSADEIADGWQLLFDGKSKTGWHVYNNQSNGDAWETKNGVLYLNPKEIMVTPVQGAGDLTQVVGGGDLATDQEFDNFHLKLEWKVDIPGNSGVMIYVHETLERDYSWQTGPEIQIMHQRECGDDMSCVGDLYSLVAGPRDLEISDDWNSLEVISDQGTLEVLMNGRLLYAVEMWDENWESLIAKTKFTDWPDFGTYQKGRIVLQDHGHAVWYRNIKIRKL